MCQFQRTLTDYPADIQDRISIDFRANEASAREVIEQHLLLEPTSDRVLRCAIFVAAGNIEKLRSNLALARSDNRDMIVAAEYGRFDVRLRDFNHPFPERYYFRADGPINHGGNRYQ